MKKPFTYLILVATVLATGLTAAPASATASARIPIPKVKSVQLKVDVAGYITVTHDWDSTGPCQDGEAYTVEENFYFETGKGITTRFTRTQFPGKESLFGASVSKPVGSAITSGRVDGWRTSSACTNAGPAPTPPDCRTATGKLQFVFALAGESASEDEEITPLAGRSLLLYLTRKGGGSQSESCLRARPSIDDVGVNYGDTLIDSNPNDGVMGAVLPTGIDSIKALNLKKGKSITRTVTMTGPCEAVRVENKAGGTLESNPQQCWVKGKAVVTVTRPR